MVLPTLFRLKELILAEQYGLAKSELQLEQMKQEFEELRTDHYKNVKRFRIEHLELDIQEHKYTIQWLQEQLKSHFEKN